MNLTLLGLNEFFEKGKLPMKNLNRFYFILVFSIILTNAGNFTGLQTGSLENTYNKNSPLTSAAFHEVITAHSQREFFNSDFGCTDYIAINYDPDAIYNDGSCEYYCDSPNPAGCNQTGCPYGYECDIYAGDGAPSGCICAGDWVCTTDGLGGACVLLEEDCTSGDMNDDSVVDVLDLMVMVEITLEGILPEFYQICAGDNNADGFINIQDIVWLVDLILNPEPSIYINSGESYGECGGYCVFQMILEDGDVHYTASSWWYAPPVPELCIDDQLDPDTWQQIVSFIDFENFLTLNDVYGCPDCTDGGAEWIEIAIGDTSHFVLFENTVPGFEELVQLLRSIRQSYYSQLFPWR